MSGVEPHEGEDHPQLVHDAVSADADGVAAADGKGIQRSSPPRPPNTVGPWQAAR